MRRLLRWLRCFWTGHLPVEFRLTDTHSLECQRCGKPSAFVSR